MWGWYLPAMAPTVLYGDMSEFQYLAWQPGITHGTGFPVYIWLGHLFSYLPFGTVAWRVTLLSGAAAAGTLLVLYMILIELGVGRGLLRWIAALLGAGALAYSWMFWRHAIVSEVYTLHLFFCALVLWLAVRWGTEQRDWLLFLGAYLWALSWGNHMMATTLGPPLVVYCLCHNPYQWLDWRRIWKLTAWFCAGLGTFVFLFFILWVLDLPQSHLNLNIRPTIDLYNVDPSVWPSFWRQWWFVQSGEQFYRLMLTAPAAWKSLQWELLPYRVAGEFLPVAAGVAALGWLYLWAVRWRFNLLLTTLVLTQMIMNINYHMTWEIYAYYMPIYLAAALWVGAGATALFALVERLTARTIRRMPEVRASLVVMVCGALSAGLIFLNLKTGQDLFAWSKSQPKERQEVLNSAGDRPDFSREKWGYEQAHRILLECGGEACIYIGPFTLQYTLYYVAQTEFGRADFAAYELYPLAPKPGLSPSRVKLIDENLDHKTVLLGQRAPEIERRFAMQKVSDLPELWKVIGYR